MDPVPVLAMTTDIHGQVDTEFFTVETTDQSVRLVRCDGSDAVFDRGELEAALKVEGRQAA